MTSSFLTLNINADGCTEPDINRAGRFLAACGCNFYNITTAARYNEAEKLIRTLHYQAPLARAIWRGWPSDDLEDGGIWKRTTPQEWVNYRIKPNRRWLNEFDVLVLPCNEVGTLGADTRTYAEWEADVIRLSDIQFEVSLAVLRLSTGNPLETEHDNYNAVLQAASEYGAVLSPNEYTSTRTEVTTNWHVGRYRWMWKQQDKLGVMRSPVVVGEWGIARVNYSDPIHPSLDPYKGYADVGVNTDDHIAIVKRDGTVYQADNTPVCWFTLGKWLQGNGTFSIQNDESLLSAVEAEAKLGRLNMISNTIKNGRLYTIVMTQENIPVYLTPAVDATRVIGKLPNNASVTAGNAVRIGGDTFIQIKHSSFKGPGWILKGNSKLTETVEVPIVQDNIETKPLTPDTKPLPAEPQAPPQPETPPAPVVAPKPAETPKFAPLDANELALLKVWRGQLEFEINKHKAEIAMLTPRLTFINQVLEANKTVIA